MAEIADLKPTDAQNVARFPEGQKVPTLNDGGRALEGILARWFADINGSIVSTGTAPDYAVATSRTFIDHDAGVEIKFRAHAAVLAASQSSHLDMQAPLLSSPRRLRGT
ncbi:MAG: hypothetical protein ACR2OF_00020 [Hyphomicrobium sp.]